METAYSDDHGVTWKQVSEELNSVETVLALVALSRLRKFQKNLIVWKLLSCPSAAFTCVKVSEELNSVETKHFVFCIGIRAEFQKNLIVWKQYLKGKYFALSKQFQKNLIVWKLPPDEAKYFRVSMFQKNLIVWKQYLKGKYFALSKQFQKNLIVWKLSLYSSS